jgi:hypothetical protein
MTSIKIKDINPIHFTNDHDPDIRIANICYWLKEIAFQLASLKELQGDYE